MSNIPNIKKTPLMEKYEEETGKLAIWKGEVSKQFKRWKNRKEKEEIKKEKLEIVSQSRVEKKKMKKEAKEDKIAGKDYEHLIVVENLHKTYLLGTTAVAALRGVDLTIDNGDFVDIMGPSGSGKTTLLNLIGGLDTPTRGKIFLEGRNISMLNDNDLAEIRRERIGFVFQFYNLLPQMTAMENVIRQVQPKIVLLGQNDIGRDLGPRLAFRLGTAIVMDCLALSIDSVLKQVLQTKPVYGGNAQAIYSNDCEPHIVTIRTKVFPPLELDRSRNGEVISIRANIDPAISRVKFIEKVKEEIEGIKLEDAAVVIGGGRGMGGQEGFKQLEELAKLLTGAVGASRLACDNGWISDTLQIGLTGKIVTPDLYIAVGISGSTQHMAGCSGSKVIVAINKDPEANIFQEARYGVIEDWKKIIPPLSKKIKELLSD